MGGFIRGLLKFIVGVAVILGVAYGAIYMLTQRRLATTYAIEVAPVTVPTDAEAIAHGGHVFVTRACAECHGTDASGAMIVDDPLLGTAMGPNLTSGKGGLGGTLTDADYVRAVRHGVGTDGKGLVVMPSKEYAMMADSDLLPLIAYLKQVPPVDHEVPDVKFRPLGQLLVIKGDFAPDAEDIDHTATVPDAPPMGETAEYGAYLANTCKGCHGPTLSGGKIASAPPDWPPAQNLTPDTATGLGQWTESDFFKAIREQTRPDGTKLNPVMPAVQFARMTDSELKALWAYLVTVEAKAEGNH